MNPIYIILAIVIVVIIILVNVIKKKSQELEQQRIQEKQKEAAKKEEELEKLWLSRIENNDALNICITEVATKCCLLIAEHPERDQEFEIYSTEQDFAFGLEFQQKWLKHINELIDVGTPEYLLVYNFIKLGVPELSGIEEMNRFSKAFTTCVINKLSNSGLHLTLGKKLAAIPNDENLISWLNEKSAVYIYYLKYDRVKTNASW